MLVVHRSRSPAAATNSARWSLTITTPNCIDWIVRKVIPWRLDGGAIGASSGQDSSFGDLLLGTDGLNSYGCRDEHHAASVAGYRRPDGSPNNQSFAQCRDIAARYWRDRQTLSMVGGAATGVGHFAGITDRWRCWQHIFGIELRYTGAQVGQ